MTTTPHPFDSAKIEQSDPPPSHSGTMPPPLSAAPEPEKPSTSEVMDTLTGYDELAIEKAFGSDVETLINTGKGLKYLRALAFVQELHDGAKHDDARKTALAMPQSELTARFREDDEDDDLPGSESGKDGA